MKKLMYVLIIATCFMFKDVVHAGSLSISSSSSSLFVGGTVKIYVNANGLAGRFKVTSSDTSILSGGTNSIWLENQTQAFTFTAKKAGRATITVTPVDAADLSTNAKYQTSRSLSVTVSVPSSNNYLSSLKVGDYELSPEFNKETLEYNVEVPNDVRQISILGTKDNSTSLIRGTGTFNLNEGLNSFDIIVTAQNGAVRTYKVHITVKELDPIEVTVDGNEYTVIRKKELLPSINEYFTLSTTKIGEDTVPCYINETINMTLVGLQSGETKNLFIYDGEFKPYNEISSSNLFIQILDMDMNLLGEGYTLTKIDFGSKSYTAYRKEGYAYPVIYGMNIKTGDKALYKYDDSEDTFQRMETIEIKNNEQLYFIIILCLIGFNVLSYVLFIVLLLKKGKKKKVKKVNKKYDFDYDEIKK